MNIEQARYMSVLNRKELARMYEQKSYFKEMKKYGDETGNINQEHYAHKVIKRLTNSIAKLMEVQKQLKADIRYKVAIARVNRYHTL